MDRFSSVATMCASLVGILELSVCDFNGILLPHWPSTDETSNVLLVCGEAIAAAIDRSMVRAQTCSEELNNLPSLLDYKENAVR